jgi:hypothetical protein
VGGAELVGMNILTELIDSVLRMPGEFAAIATSDPLSAVLIAIGGLLTGVSVLVFGYLAVGGLASLFVSDEAEPRQPAR